MSSRQLRKLQKQKELEKTTPDPEDSDESDEPAPTTTKPRVSLFAALGGDDEDEDKQDDDQDQDESQPAPIESAPSTEPKKNKKKSKKKKKKAKEPVIDETQADEDDIDKALKELKVTPPGDAQVSSPSDRPQSSTLFTINTTHLKAINEMRTLFGRDVIESAEQEEQQGHNQRNWGRPGQQVDLETFLRGPPWQKKLPEVSLRRNVFIQGREHWPLDTARGLAMVEVRKGPRGEWTEYAFEHRGDYDRIQAMFFSYVQMGDPQLMIRLLQEFPYHVSTLLQMSNVAKQDQNMALSAELIERALFTFGRVCLSSFRRDMELGRARLDFRRPENRQFWLAGYHYLRSLIRKGTYRTALEWAKLLYCLDREDPYAIRYYVQLLAIRAYEARWFLDFLGELEVDSENRDTSYIRQSAVLAKLQLDDVDGARQDLEQGIKRVPWLYCALFQELGLDAPPSVWGMHAESDPRAFWVKLYTYQMKELWNNTKATDLLKEVAGSLPKVDTSALPKGDPPPDLGATRLAFLEGQTSLLAVAPRPLLESQPNYEFDPLPPAEDDNIFTGEGVRLPWREGAGQTEGRDGALARMLEHMRRHVPVRAAVGDDDDEGPDEAWEDDAELMADLEAATSSEGPGVVARLMQLLGVRGGGGNQATVEDAPDGEEEWEAPPGSWPEEGR